MADSPQRKVKVTGAAAHRVGAHRAAIKPHKRETGPDYKQIINDYLNGLRAGSTQQTMWGENVEKNAQAIRSLYGLAENDEPYLLLNLSGDGRTGMTLSSTGIHLADGRGGSATITWADLAKTSVGYQRGMLVIGQSGITSTDAQVLAALLQQIQQKIAQ